MGMVLQLPPPGVQDTGEARQIGADIPRISGQFFNSSGSRIEQGFVGKALIAATKWPDLLGHGEGEHEVVSRQSAAQLVFQPIAALMVLAPWAVAVAAGSVDAVGCTAALAPIECDTEVAGAAVDDGIDDFFVLIGQVGKTLQVFRGKGPENIGDGRHCHTSFITELMIW